VIVATGSDPASVAAGQTVTAEDVDQRVDPTGPDGWHSFGLVTLGANQNTIVLQLTDKAAGYVLADAARITVPQPLHSADAAVGRAAAPLPPESLQPILGQAIAAWQATGISPAELSRLYATHVVVTDLPGAKLGLGSRLSNSVWLDIDAAGHGWNVSRGTRDEGRGPEGLPPSGPGPSTLDPRPKIDLLTVLSHELGHVLGYADVNPHSAAAGVMVAELAAGERVLPSLGTRLTGWSETGSPWDLALDGWSWDGFDGLGASFGESTNLLPAADRRSGMESGPTREADARLTDALFAVAGDEADLIAEDGLGHSADSTGDRPESDDGLELWSLLNGLGR
jgi:hypothetical protein